jgi:hypothetical protein
VTHITVYRHDGHRCLTSPEDRALGYPCDWIIEKDQVQHLGSAFLAQLNSTTREKEQDQ